MSGFRWSFSLGVCLFAIASQSADAQTPTVYLVPSNVMANPGDTVVIEVFARDIFPTDVVRGYEVRVTQSASGGTSGSVEHDGNFPVVDNSRPDYLFHGVDGVFGFPAPGPPPVVGAASTSDSVQVVDPAYLGEMSFVVSGDANGSFTLSIVDDNSLVLNANSEVIPFQTIGTTINVGDIGGGDPPFIIHSQDDPNPAAPATAPCSGYIDPRRESDNGVDINQGIQSVVIVFNEQVRNVGGGALSSAAFSVTQTGGGVAPTVSLDPGNTFVDGVTGRHVVQLDVNGIPAIQEWMTIIASVENLSGMAIDSVGNLGPGMNEPDRVDIGYLTCDFTQDGSVSAFDLVRFKQYILGTCSACTGFICGADFATAGDTFYADTDRSGSRSAFDLVRFTQHLRGTGTQTTRMWLGMGLNNPRP